MAALCERSFVRRSLNFLIFIMFLLVSACDFIPVDVNGYIAYCPCMGRFGNQADHFLGALGFARGLNRTLIVPPWVEYRQGASKSVQVPFDTYFKVEPLLEYHRVVTMEIFMRHLAPILWPPGNRTVLCYRSREGVNDCLAKEGNPFGPFWDTFLVDFDKSEFYGPLHYDVHHHEMAKAWNEKYPASAHSVLAFMGAPASFPVQAENRALHRYMQWSDTVRRRADDFIRMSLPKGPFVGIHLRNGVDWTNACQHVDQSPNLFAAPQCLGYNNEYGRATTELCFPSRQTVLKQLKRAVKEAKAKSVFIASDNDHMIAEINRSLRKLKVAAFRFEPPDPHVDLAILGMSNHFIGNCISTFSAFAKRERDASGFPSSFWSFPIIDDDQIVDAESREEL